MFKRLHRKFLAFTQHRHAGATILLAVCLAINGMVSIQGGASTVSLNDLLNSAVFGQTVKSQVVAATLNGAAVDLVDTEGPTCMEVNAGVCTDGGYTVTVEESDASGGSYTPVALNAVMPEIITTTDDQIYTRRFKRSKRFCRAVITESTAGTTGVVIGITFIGMKKVSG